MKEIKFRGKRSNDNIWIFGDLLNIYGSYHILGKNDIVEDGHHVRQDSDVPTWVEKETVCQFTGLKDIKGVNIYEGDIIKSRYGKKHFIRYFEDESAFLAVPMDDDDFASPSILSKRWIIRFDKKVIGNIYDNEESEEAK